MTEKNASLQYPIGNKKKKSSQPDFAQLGQSLVKAIEEQGSSKPSNGDPLLSIVATPIGNLGDISMRALWTLASADAILCEDTRVTGLLLHRFGINKPLLSCHDHNEEARAKDVIERLNNGQSLALVSDAGTPMISDPGYRVVRACRQAGFCVVAVPGASALLSALACGGLPTDRFLFVGFLPAKASARRKELESLAQETSTMIFYEAPQRLAATLADMNKMFGATRMAVVARELTKLYEDVQGAELSALCEKFEEGPTPKGEVVILVTGAQKPENDSAAQSQDMPECVRHALQSMSLRDAVAHVTALTGAKRSEVYAVALKLSEKQ